MLLVLEKVLNNKSTILLCVSCLSYGSTCQSKSLKHPPCWLFQQTLETLDILHHCALTSLFCVIFRFQLIVETWNELPSHRPTFKDVVFRFARIIEAHCNPDVSWINIHCIFAS